MRSFLFKATIFFIIIAAFSGCDKLSYECSLDVYTNTEADKGGTVYQLKNVVGYLYYGDTLDYKIDSYDQAISGFVTTTVNNDKRKYDLKATFIEEGYLLKFEDLNQPVAFIVVCDTQNQIYSFKQQEIAKGIASITVVLTTYPWQFVEVPDTTILVNKWKQLK